VNTPGLSFLWQRGFQFPIVLLGFILLSAFGHAVTFYLFHVEYPPSVTITPPPTRVTLLRPDTPANRALLDWIAESDPALLARPPEIAAPATGPFAYEPSYAAARPAPVRPPNAPPSAPRPLPAATSGLALMDRLLSPRAAPPEPAPPIVSTSLVLSAEIADRVPKDPAAPEFDPVETHIPLSPATYLLAIGRSGGTPELVFPQSGSGSDSLNDQAEKHVRNLRFHAADDDQTSEVTWGFATFVWGPDVQRRAPQIQDPP
jgi:hypothetical protein